jgi:hypothetical protein
VKVSSLKDKFKSPGNRFRQMLKPFRGVQESVSRSRTRTRTRGIGNFDKRTLLIILIPLLILLLIVVVAFADTADGKEYSIKINSHKDTKTQRGAFVAKTKQEE